MNPKFKLTQHVIVIEQLEGGVPRLLNISGKPCDKGEIGLLLEALEHHQENKPAMPEESVDNSDPGHVYLLEGGGYHKIGRSKNAEWRHRNLGILMPFEVSLEHVIKTSTPKKVEAYWHSRYGEKRSNGEWFKLSNQDVLLFRSFDSIELPDDDFLFAMCRLTAFHAIQGFANIYHCPATLNGVLSLDRSQIGPFSQRLKEFIEGTFDESPHLSYLDGELSRYIA